MGTFMTKSDILRVPVPTDRDAVEVWHERVKGFGVRVHRASVRTGEVRRVYLARYSTLSEVKGQPGEQQRKRDVKAVLGTLDEISFDDAEDKAKNLRREATHKRKTGEDPVPTLRKAYDNLIALKSEVLSPTTLADYEKRLGYVQQHWHTSVVSLCRPEVWQKVYLDISREHGRATAVGVIRVCKTVFRSLKDDGVITLDPTAKLSQAGLIRNGPPKQRLVKRQDLPKFWSFLHQKVHPTVRDYLVFVLMTFLRSSVVGALRWEHVDIEKRLILVPEDVKGNKTKRLVWIPVCNYLLDNVLLPRYEARGSSPWVFGSTRLLDGPLHNVRGSLTHLSSETGILISIHDVRRTGATIAREATGDPLMVSRMLTHNVSGSDQGTRQVTAGYIVHEQFEYRQAFEVTSKAVLAYANAKDSAEEVFERLLKEKKQRLQRSRSEDEGATA